MRVLRAVGVAAAVLIGLAGCGAGDEPTAAGPATESGAPASAAAFPRTVTHAMGTTEIPAAPKRVVALDQSFVDAVVALDAEVVGFTTYRSLSEKLPDYLGENAQRYGANAQVVGTLEAPGLEKIIALKPDLIVSAKVRHEALYDKLSKIAPTVFSETTGALWKENLRLMGTALGKEDLAEQRIGGYEKRAQGIGAAIKAKNSGTMPSVTIARFAGEPTVRLYVENSYSGIVLKDVGLPRPQGQPTTTDTIAVDISEERIADLDADHIFVATYPDDKGDVRKIQQKFEANPLWARLKGERHEVDDLTWMTACGILGAEKILDDLAGTFGVPATGA
ncbi:ABC transporter periplasmic component [Sphaerisporangium krabiense]|uniref:Iron complex transport system substrate-binding protein n=1 Tax=Sphaerisporangium krabiense TaxID=763782 RepID=A0A7W9DQT0_9ACTN|nr:iron-siderophore ABC transporter substrate-binding protein [Sphaerisporangium krabiense]MBB5627862.1 iron complex transport system substrate-binding protein [Sphaerisporangium krabiense]GII62021.1 ABC transporter periplasmic component [Sphaerisporangium krabiense]